MMNTRSILHKEDMMVKRENLVHVMRYIFPNLGTILIVVALLWVRQAGAANDTGDFDTSPVPPADTRGTLCLSEIINVDVPGGWEHVAVPGLNLPFNLAADSTVLAWIDGTVRFEGPNGREFAAFIEIDDSSNTAGDLSFAHPKWFNVSGMRMVDLPAGKHVVRAMVASGYSGYARVHGDRFYKTCVSYLVVGETGAGIIPMENRSPD